MLTKTWKEALEKANAYKKAMRYLIGQQLNGEWYYLAMYKQGAGQTTNFNEEKLNLGPLSGVRVWTNAETNGFDFKDNQAARESKYRLFGDDKRYTIVAAK